MNSTTPLRKRIVSGNRPTGRLHIGHYHGALKNWIQLAETHDCFFFSADWHALTTGYQDPREIRANERDMFVDWMAAGLDPSKCTLFVQSAVKEHAELHLLLSMLTPISWLERVPSYKEMQEELKDRDLATYGFLGYPLLQTADIVVYKANAVPVGVDQLPHIELAREIVRRFNFLYGREVFPEPEGLLSEIPKILGTDRRKMSKSYGNTILLGEKEEVARQKIMTSQTDPQRMRRQDPGNPEVCPIFHMHRAYSPPERVATVDVECRRAGIGCVDCKKWLLEGLLPPLEAHRKKREEILRQPELVQLAVGRGIELAREVASQTMKDVREAMSL